MIVGKVVGSVVSTRKSEKLIGSKFMIIEPVHHMKGDLSQLVAIDMIGAGVGEYVLITTRILSAWHLRTAEFTKLFLEE